jgi:cell division protein FtsB
MKPEPGIWNKLTWIVIVLIIIAGLIALGSRYLPLIQRNERMRREIHRLETELETEKQTARQLQQEIDLLTKDPAALEREIRSRLGLAREGETVIRFDTETTNTSSTIQR